MAQRAEDCAPAISEESEAMTRVINDALFLFRNVAQVSVQIKVLSDGWVELRTTNMPLHTVMLAPGQEAEVRYTQGQEHGPIREVITIDSRTPPC